jgi:pRiA4b ORF-3-like protein
MPPRSPTSVHQLKVTLKGIRPPIWRRVQVSSTINLRRLHDVIQETMGWTQSHLYEFEIFGERYGEPSLDEDYGMPTRSAKSTPLRRIAPEAGIKLTYTYDFGDDWEHQIVVEKVLPPERGIAYPRCLTGRRACPPEDVGGIWGYQEFLEAIRDVDHAEHERMLEWVGGDFDPEAFDAQEVNEGLAVLGPSPWDR